MKTLLLFLFMLLPMYGCSTWGIEGCKAYLKNRGALNRSFEDECRRALPHYSPVLTDVEGLDHLHGARVSPKTSIIEQEHQN